MGSPPRKHASQGGSASPFFSSSCVTSSPLQAPCWDPDSVIKGSSKSQMCLRRIMATILHHFKTIPGLPVVRSLNLARDPTEARASALFEELKPSGAPEARVPALKSDSGCRLIDLNLRLGPTEAGEVPENEEVNWDSACSGVRRDAECRGKDCGSSAESANGFASQRSESEGVCNPKGVGDLETAASNSEKVQASEVIDGCAEAARSGDGSRHSFSGHTDGITFANNPTKEKGNADDEENDNDAECYSIPPASCSKEEAKPSQRLPTRVAEKDGASGEGYLDLLIEAVQLVSGDVFATESDDDPTNPPSEGQALGERNDAAASSRSRRSSSKRLRMFELYDGFDESAPVVRSKRGRNQTLPSRYRDSVLDPWKRFPLRKLGALPNRPAKRSS